MLRSRLGALVFMALIAISAAIIVFTIVVRERELAVARTVAAAQVAAASTGSDLFVNGDRVERVTFDAPTSSQVGDTQFVRLSVNPLAHASKAGLDNLGSGFLIPDLKAPGFAITALQDGPQPTTSDQINWSWEIAPSDIGQRFESHQFVIAEISFDSTLPQPGSPSRLVYLDVVATQVVQPWYSQISIIVPLLTGTLSLLGLFVGMIWRLRAKPSSSPQADPSVST
jgi:hypothetical protein